MLLLLVFVWCCSIRCLTVCVNAMTPFYWCDGHAHWLVVCLLIQGGPTIIHLAAQNNSKTILNRLLLLMGQCCCPCPCSCAQWGLTVDIDDNYGRTPLWWAANKGHVDCVEVLLVHGANPDHKWWWIRYSSVSNITDITSYCHSKNGKSPLDIAKKRGHTTVVSMMTEASKRK